MAQNCCKLKVKRRLSQMLKNRGLD